MAFTCIQIIKYVGVASLGVATSTLAYNANAAIPTLLASLAGSSASKSSTTTTTTALRRSLAWLINTSRAAVAVFGSAAAYACITAYRYSATSQKHPYLLYSAAGVPLSWIVYLTYLSFAAERSIATALAEQAETTKAFPPLEKPAHAAPEVEEAGAEASPLDNSVYGEVAGTTTSLELESVSSASVSENQSPEEVAADLNLELEINLSLLKNSVSVGLRRLQGGYNAAASVLGVSFALLSIGVLGEAAF